MTRYATAALPDRAPLLLVRTRDEDVVVVDPRATAGEVAAAVAALPPRQG